MSAGIDKIQVRGLKELRAALKEVDAKAPKLLQKANKAAANLVVGPARARMGQHSPRAGSRAAGTIRALASGTKAQIGVGSNAVPWALGHEFGGRGRPHRIGKQGHTMMFPPHRGQDGYAVYPTIRAMRAEIMDQYGDMIDELVQDSFPD